MFTARQPPSMKGTGRMGVGNRAADVGDAGADVGTLKKQLIEHETTQQDYIDGHVDCPRCARSANKGRKRLDAPRRMPTGGSEIEAELPAEREGRTMTPAVARIPSNELQSSTRPSGVWKDVERPFDPRPPAPAEDAYRYSRHTTRVRRPFAFAATEPYTVRMMPAAPASTADAEADSNPEAEADSNPEADSKPEEVETCRFVHVDIGDGKPKKASLCGSTIKFVDE